MPSRLARLLRRLLRSGRVHEDASVARQRRILQATRSDLLAATAVLAPESFRAAQLAAVLDAIDRVLDPRRAESLRVGAADTRTAWSLGRAQADSTVTVPPVPVVSIAADLLQAVIDVTEDQLREVWRELGGTLKASVRRVALGAQKPDEAIDLVARHLRTAKTFGTVATRAEVIVRTEVNRTYSIAADARFRELNASVFDGALRKAWLATSDPRTRPSHRAAGATYTRANAIPIEDPFIVGGATLRYPLDPLAPAQEVVQCRCRMIAIPPSLDEVEWAGMLEELHVEEVEA